MAVAFHADTVNVAFIILYNIFVWQVSRDSAVNNWVFPEPHLKGASGGEDVFGCGYPGGERPIPPLLPPRPLTVGIQPRYNVFE